MCYIMFLYIYEKHNLESQAVEIAGQAMKTDLKVVSLEVQWISVEPTWHISHQRML
eukprot:UN14174